MITALVTLFSVSVTMAVPHGVCLNDLIGLGCCDSASACAYAHSCCRPVSLPSCCSDRETTSCEPPPMSGADCSCATVNSPSFVTSLQQDRTEMEQLVVPVLVALLSFTPDHLAGVTPAPDSPFGTGSWTAPVPPSQVSCVLRI